MTTYVRTDLGDTLKDDPPRTPGRVERRLDLPDRVVGPRADQRWDDPLAAAVGFVPVDESRPRPADTATETSDPALVMVDTVPTRVWNVRAKTQAELDADAAEQKRREAWDWLEENVAGSVGTLDADTLSEAVRCLDTLTRGG